MEKKSKNGISEQNIIPMIQDLKVENMDEDLVIKARICCQNPSLNPMQLVQAIDKYLPELKPDFVRCCRMELYDSENTIFR